MTGLEYVIAQLGVALQLANQRIAELEAELKAAEPNAKPGA